MSRNRLCVYCHPVNGVTYSAAPEPNGTSPCVSEPDCPCENLLADPALIAAGVTNVYTATHPDPTFNTVGTGYDPCTVTNSTTCYICDVSNSGYLSQVITSGSCPTGWSTTIPSCGATAKLSVSAAGGGLCSGPPTSGCNVCFNSACTSTGAIQTTVLVGLGLTNVQLQQSGSNVQLNTCSPISPNPFITTSVDGDVFTVTGYCGSPSIIDQWQKSTSSSDAPSWGAADCGEVAVSSNTKIYAFYDGTSLGESQAEAAYTALTAWLGGIANFTVDTVHGSATQNVFHTAVSGERWVDWGSAVLTGKFNNSQVTPYEQVSVNGGTYADFTHCTGGSDCAVKRNAGNNLLIPNYFNSPANNSKQIAQLNWAYDTAGVDEFYDTAEGSLIGASMFNYGSSAANGAQTWNGFPPKATNTDDVLIVIFADESMWSYHANSTNVFTLATDPYTHSSGGVTFAGIDPAQPTPQYRQDYDKFTQLHAAHNGEFRAFLYPSKPASVSESGGHKAFPLHALAAIHSGNKAPLDGMFQAGTSPINAYTTLTKIETENPYWTATTPTYGGLDQKGWGVNVAGITFTAANFAIDLEAFLGIGTVNCDQTDCAALRVVDGSGVGISGVNVTIGSSYLQTDSSGYTTLVSGLAGGVLINGCETFNFTGDCTQYLFEIVQETYTDTVSQSCILGCTDPNAMNYNPLANVDDGSCEYCVWGCTNPVALNYDPLATCDDGSCQNLPDIVECTLINMAKELLKECLTECGDAEAYVEMQFDFREMEAMLAQIYMLIECNNLEELRALMPKIVRLMEKYQCDSCYSYSSTDGGDTTTTQTETSATSCGADVTGPCTNKLLTPAIDALQIEYQVGTGGWIAASTDQNTTIGDITGNTLDVTSYCGPTRIEQALNACGMTSVPNDANIYCFYDVTSTCNTDIAEIVNSVEVWYRDKVIADPSFTGDVFHLPVHGEKWVAAGFYPLDGQMTNGAMSLVNGSGNDLGGGNSGYSTTLSVTVLDRSTIGTTHSMVSRTLYGPKSGTAVANDIATDTSGGAIPYLAVGGSYSDRGLAGGVAADLKAVVLCFFDEAEGTQGGGAYHDRGLAPNGSSGNYHYPPIGVVGDWGTAPYSKWISHHATMVSKYPQYTFFKGFLYPVVPGCHIGGSNCGIEPANQNPVVDCRPHSGKMHFILNSLAGITSGTLSGPLPQNAVINTATGGVGTLSSMQVANNPYTQNNVDGLDQYGWSMDPTVGTPGIASIAGVFTSNQFANTLNGLLTGGSTCDGTDCLTVIIKDAETSAVISDTYTQTAVTVNPGVQQLLAAASNVTLTTLGDCTEYIVTIFKDEMDQYSDCVTTASITCGCAGDDIPSIVISVGANTNITGQTKDGATSYGTITNETTGVVDVIAFDPNQAGPLVGSITLDGAIKDTKLFESSELGLPDGRYKIVLDNVGGEKLEMCLLILCHSYESLLDAFERYTLDITCCPTCTSPYDAYLSAYTIYRALKVTGLDCGLEKWIDKNIIKLQDACKACSATAECNQTC